MRRRRQDTGAARAPRPVPQLSHPFSPQAIFSDDAVADLHATALEVLETLGIRVLLPEARELLAARGARISDGDMVQIGADMVNEALRTAPRQFTLRAANPLRDREIAPGRLIFAAGGGCPNVTDRVRGRRPGDLAAFRDALRLQQHFDVIHTLAPAPEPQDIAPNLRHFAMTQAQLELSDKPLVVYARGRGQVEQCFEMVQLAHGLDFDRFAAAPRCATVINTNSPRLLDAPMAQGLIDFARAGQMVIVTPFCLAGAMAPVTVAGALALQHAEALAAITLSQMAAPGAPVMYGGFGSNVDMRSGAPAFGTPEHIQMCIGSGQLARHIGLPWRSGMGTAANTNDMQAAGETHMSLWGNLMAQATLVIHAAGWLEGGLTLGFEKFINDVEALEIIAHLCTPPEASAEAMGFDAIAGVPPGGHFFDSALTLARYREAFRSPINAEMANFGTWQEAGGATAEERATALWQTIIAEFRPPPGCDARADRIIDYVARMEAVGGAPILD